MPRRPRIHFDGVPLHIVQRGHNREPCFFSENDYARYLLWLAEALAESNCQLHAYALMTNHVHLLLTPQKSEAIPRLLISLGRRYVQYVNRVYSRTGTLWDSRYKSSLVQAETYLLACHRYIELNPVRAAMVADPAQYPWTSYRSNALGHTSTWLTPHPLYLALGQNAKARCENYRAIFQSHSDQAAIRDLRSSLQQNQPVGDSWFHAKIERITGIRREAKPRGRPRRNEVAIA
jgi:putative transposase